MLPIRFPFAAVWLPSLVLALFLGGVISAHAQVQVDLKLARRSYILYEDLPATVTITNNAGRDITLADEEGVPWLGFDVTRNDGGMVPPYESNYTLPPLTIPAGKTLEKKINLTPLFPIREMGEHRVRVNVHFADTAKFYYSNYASFDLTDGRLIWRQSVGVPGSSDEVRQASLLTQQLPNRLLLYLRIRDEDGNNVYTTQSLGRMIITGRAPQQMFDQTNTLHILQESMPGIFTYTVVNLDGQRLDQKAYVRQGSSRPTLVKTESGQVAVRGGQVQVALPPDAGGTRGEAKLSDRPAGLPGKGPRSGN